MAKYKMKDNKHFVDVDILNEHYNNYVVRFKNGIIQKVSKNRVTRLNKIDEGVLDKLRNVVDTTSKYGRKFKEKASDVIEKIKNFFVSTFVIDNFAFFVNGEGEPINATHPVNTMEAAKTTPCMNFIPGGDVQETCRELGIDPISVENFEFSGEGYNGSIDFSNDANESLKNSKSLLMSIVEAEETRLKSDEKIHLQGTFQDYNREMIVQELVSQYMERYNGRDTNADPLFIWGAPGIGKTAIIRSLKDVIKEITGEEISILSINGGNVGPDDFTMPAKIERKLDGQTTETVIKDLPKSTLPVYDTTEGNEEVRNAIANGGKVVKDENGNDVIQDGPGGIFFIDEYSRMTQAGMDSLMQTPITREIGANSSLKFGSRWVIVVAGNRPEDMSRRGSSEALSFEGASKTRFCHVNFVPDPQDWLEWARRKSEKRPGRTNILPEIIQYIESEVKRDPKEFGDFYEMYKHPKGELQGEKATACPRSWEAVSERLIYRFLDNYIGKKYDALSMVPKAELVRVAAGTIGEDVAKRFATFVSQFSLFTPKDAENVWTKGDNAKYEIIKQQKLNSANIEEYFTKHIFPLLKSSYPGGIEDGISPDAALNFMKFLDECCYDAGKFNLNRFKTISTMFGNEFGVDLRSVSGPYAEVANYKEDVIAKNELI